MKLMKTLAGLAMALCVTASAQGQAIVKTIKMFPCDTNVPNPDCPEGANPIAGLIQGSDGALYGTCFGWQGPNTLFKIKPDGTGFTNLFIFGDYGPFSAAYVYNRLLLGKDGALYGTTYLGGLLSSTNPPWGTVFKINTDGTGFSLLHVFPAENVEQDGEYPQGGLIQGSDGALYGTTQFGGGGMTDTNYPNQSGTIFKINPDGTGYTILYRFNGPNSPANDGYNPVSTLVQGADGALYGTTVMGGNPDGRTGFDSDGTVFKINTDGTGYAVLHRFTGNSTEGAGPEGGLIQGADGALYGMTRFAGLGTISAGGIIYKLNTNGAGFTTLHSFEDVGFSAATLLQLADGGLYGTTAAYAGGGYDTVFRINPDGTGYSEFYNFQFGELGPGYGPLIQGNDGALYGTTVYGGSNQGGTVFKLILPTRISLQRTNLQMTLSWDSVSNQNYQVEYTSDLLQTSWTNLGGPIHATDRHLTTLDAITGSQRFYRVVMLP